MKTSISEFIDTYSDDIISLQEGRKALLTHPLRRTLPELCDASFPRILAVIMIGSLEMMLNAWKEKDQVGVLDRYFRDGVSNGERVQSLYDAFQKAGIKVDRGVFDDFLAIKYLRNAVVHAGWKGYETEWLEQRGFPTDTRKLTSEHWRRILSVNQTMMLYIALTEHLGASEIPAHQTIAPINVAEEDTSGVLRKKHFPMVYWNNLERISEVLYRNIEKATLTGDYYWAKGLNRSEIEAMPFEDKKRLFYCAGRMASEKGMPLVVQHRELARESLDFWKEYWRLTFARAGVTPQMAKSSTAILDRLHQKAIYPRGAFPLPKAIPAEIMRQIIRSQLSGYEPLTEDQIILALNIGATAYEMMPNITAVWLLVELLPVVDPANTEAYLEEGEKALAMMELHDYWYSYVERREAPAIERWASYERMLSEFRARQKELP